MLIGVKFSPGTLRFLRLTIIKSFGRDSIFQKIIFLGLTWGFENRILVSMDRNIEINRVWWWRWPEG